MESTQTEMETITNKISEEQKTNEIKSTAIDKLKIVQTLSPSYYVSKKFEEFANILTNIIRSCNENEIDILAELLIERSKCYFLLNYTRECVYDLYNSLNIKSSQRHYYIKAMKLAQKILDLELESKIVKLPDFPQDLIDESNESIHQRLIEADKHKNLGNNYLKMKCYDMAIDEYTKSLLYNYNMNILLNRCICYYNLKLWFNCSLDSVKIIDLDPTLVYPYYLASLSFCRLSNYENCLTCLDKFNEIKSKLKEDVKYEKLLGSIKMSLRVELIRYSNLIIDIDQEKSNKFLLLANQINSNENESNNNNMI